MRTGSSLGHLRPIPSTHNEGLGLGSPGRTCHCRNLAHTATVLQALSTVLCSQGRRVCWQLCRDQMCAPPQPVLNDR